VRAKAICLGRNDTLLLQSPSTTDDHGCLQPQIVRGSTTLNKARYIQQTQHWTRSAEDAARTVPLSATATAEPRRSLQELKCLTERGSPHKCQVSSPAIGLRCVVTANQCIKPRVASVVDLITNSGAPASLTRSLKSTTSTP
jgi:hypothetical protein